MTRARPLAWSALLLLAGAGPAAADLVVLVDGSVIKAAAFAAEGDEARVELASGGSLRMPLLRVERVVDDEIVPEPEKAAEALEADAQAFDLRWQEGHEPPATAYGELIYDAARRHELNPELVAAVIRAESGFDARAVSSKGARGLMQLIPETGQRIARRNGIAYVDGDSLYDPGSNIAIGSAYLRDLLDRAGGSLPVVIAGSSATGTLKATPPAPYSIGSSKGTPE